MDLFIESLTGTIFELKVSPLETINSVKLKIQRAEGIPINQQNLIWQEKELKDDMSLQDYKIRSGTTIKLVLNMRGGPINTRRVVLSTPSPVISGCSSPSLHSSACASPQPPNNNKISKANNDTEIPNSSTDHLSNTHITLLVFKEGDQINFYRVDKNDSGLSPVFESIPDSPSPLAVNEMMRSENNTENIDNYSFDYDDLTKQENEKSKQTSFGVADKDYSGIESESQTRYNVDDDDEDDDDDDDDDDIFQMYKRKNYSNYDDDNDSIQYSGLFHILPYLSAGGHIRNSENIFRFNRLPRSTLASDSKYLNSVSNIGTNSIKNDKTEEINQLKEKCAILKRQLKLRKTLKMAHLSKQIPENDVNKSNVTESFDNDNSFNMSKIRNSNRPLSRTRLTPLPNRPKLTPIISNLTDKSQTSIEPKIITPTIPSSSSSSSSTTTTFNNDLNISSTMKTPETKNYPPLIFKRPSYFPNVQIGSKNITKNYTNQLPTMAQHDILPDICNDNVSKVSNDVKTPLSKLSLTKHYKTPPVNGRSSSIGATVDRMHLDSTESTVLAASNAISTDNLTEKSIQQNRPLRCRQCNKKTGLATSYTCRCGKNFCGNHRYPETHVCTHDFRNEGRRCLKDANPMISASKLPKI